MRLPLDPILAALRLTPTQLRDRINTGTGNIRRAQRDGLAPAVADRWLAKLDVHPMEIYGDDWLLAIGEELSA